MKRLPAAVLMVTVLAAAMPALAGGAVTAAPNRFILHGVDCSIDNGTVCDDERPVFDEAIDSLRDAPGVIVQTDVLGPDGEVAGTLPENGVAAVRDYFIANGFLPEQVEIRECSETSSTFSAAPLVGENALIVVQLSKSVAVEQCERTSKNQNR